MKIQCFQQSRICRGKIFLIRIDQISAAEGILTGKTGKCFQGFLFHGGKTEQFLKWTEIAVQIQGIHLAKRNFPAVKLIFLLQIRKVESGAVIMNDPLKRHKKLRKSIQQVQFPRRLIRKPLDQLPNLRFGMVDRGADQIKMRPAPVQAGGFDVKKNIHPGQKTFRNRKIRSKRTGNNFHTYTSEIEFPTL